MSFIDYLKKLRTKAQQGIVDWAAKPQNYSSASNLISLSQPSQYPSLIEKATRPQQFRQRIESIPFSPINPFSAMITLPPVKSAIGQFGANILGGVHTFFEKKPFIEHVGDELRAGGTLIAPVETMEGGAVMSAFDIAGKLYKEHRLPTGKEFNQSVGEGVKFSGMMSLLGKGTGFLLDKVAPLEREPIIKYIDLAKKIQNPAIKKKMYLLAGKRLVQSLGKSVVENAIGLGAYSGLEPAGSVEERVANVLQGMKEGAKWGLGMGMVKEAAPFAARGFKNLSDKMAESTEPKNVMLENNVEIPKDIKDILKKKKMDFSSLKKEHKSFITDDEAMKLLNRDKSTKSINVLKEAYRLHTDYYGDEVKPTIKKTLANYVDKLGADRVFDAIKEARKSEKGRRTFHDVLQKELKRNGLKVAKPKLPPKPKPSIKDNEVIRKWEDLSPKAKRLWLKNRNIVLDEKGIKQPKIKEMLKENKKATFASKLSSKFNKIMSSLPERKKGEKVENLEKNFKRSYSVKRIFSEIKKEFNRRGVTSEEFAKMVDSKKPEEMPKYDKVADLVKLHQNMMDRMLEFTGRKSGIEGGYYPHEDPRFYKVQKIMKQIFPNAWVDEINEYGGHFKKRKGTAKNISKDYETVMHNYTEQAFYDKYGLKDAEREIVDRINKAGQGVDTKDVYDYIGNLGKPERFRDKVVHKSVIKIGTDTPETINHLFSDIGKEHKEIKDAWVEVRDVDKEAELYRKKINPLIDKGNKKAVVNEFADILGKKGVAKKDFEMMSDAIVDELGLDIYSEKMFKEIRKQKFENFITTLSDYKFANPGVKETINKVIDSVLKFHKVKDSLADKMVDAAGNILATAQITGNIKVALTQLTEIGRLAVDYSPMRMFQVVSEFAKNPRKAYKILDKYGFEHTKSYYLYGNQEAPGLIEKAKRTGRGTLGKIKDFGDAPMNRMEQTKNALFTRAAEIEGESRGLKGKELRDFVRNEVYDKAHLADKWNTPIFMMDKTKIAGIQSGKLMRLLFQYSQFGIKNVYHILDYAKDKQYAKSLGMVLVNLGTLYAELRMLGYSGHMAQRFLQSFFPIGPGPVLNLFSLNNDNSIPNIAFRMFDAKAKGDIDAFNKEVKNAEKTAMYNAVPFGVQASKTMRTADILRKGYAETPAGSVKYPIRDENGLAPKVAALIFGPQMLKESQQYYDKTGDKKTTPLLKTQNEVFKSMYQEDPKGAVEYYDKVMEDRKNNKPIQIKDILKKGVKNTNMVEAGDGDIQINTPSGNSYSVSQILAKEEKEKERMKVVMSVLNRTGKYKEVPKGDRFTATLMKMNGITPEELEKAKLKKIKSLSLNSKAEAIRALILSKQYNFTQLYKEGILTPDVAKQLQRIGYIKDADALMKQMRMTDSYYIQREMRKLNKKKIIDMLKLKASIQKKLISAQTQTNIRKMKEILKPTKTYSLKPRLSKINYSNIPSVSSLLHTSIKVPKVKKFKL